MPISTQPNGLPVSALLTDPKALQKQLSNGTPTLSSTSPSALTVAEPSAFDSPASFDFDYSNTPSKDDAHVMTQGLNRGSSMASSIPGMGPSQPGFDARQLLDPKGFKPSRTNEKQVRMLGSGPALIPTSNGMSKRDADELEDHGQGMGNMIERMHGVSRRDERPQKKPKTIQSDDVDEKKPVFTGGGKGGDIGEFMREKRMEGQAQSVPTTEVVDLTAGNTKDAVTSLCAALANHTCSNR